MICAADIGYVKVDRTAAYVNGVQEEEAFANLHGCQPPQSEFKHRWPWALDLIKKHVQTVLTDHALMLQVEFTESLGITLPRTCLVWLGTSPRILATSKPSQRHVFKVRQPCCRIRPRVTDSGLRYESRSAKACLLPILWRGHLHPRWSGLEAFARNAPETIRTSPG